MSQTPRSLDDWYKLINGIYLESNFYRTLESIFTHLVEVSGGLSTALARKWKARGGTGVFLAKCIGWWMALNGKLGIRSVEELVWRKFPGVCPYCKRKPHKALQCPRPMKEAGGIDWDGLLEIGTQNRTQMPISLTDWQLMFGDIYMASETADLEKLFGRLQEELGELAEAVRLVPLSKAYFMNESADVFAWLMRLANQALVVGDDKEAGEEYLEAAMLLEYPGECRYCGSKPCKCGPILTTSLGRISREVPRRAYAGETSRPVLGYEEQLTLFGDVERGFRFGKTQVKLDVEFLKRVSDDTEEIKQQLRKKAERDHGMTEVLQKLSVDLDRLANAVSVQDQSLRAVKDHLGTLSDSRRSLLSDTLADFLQNVAGSVWAEVLIHLLGLAAGNGP